MNMAASDTPEGISLKGRPTGVRRLNRLPLFVGMAVGIIVVSLLAYAVHQRGQQTTLEEANSEQQRKADTMAPEAMSSGYAGAEIPAARPPEPPAAAAAEVAAVPAAAPAAAATASPAPPPRRPDPLEEQRKRQEQKRLQMYYGALEAPIDVNFGKQLSSAPSGNTGLPGQTPTSRHDRYRDALAQLAGAGEQDPNFQDSKNAFLQNTSPKTPMIFGRDHTLLPTEIRSGTVIPAVMVTGINSDLPGMIKAQVSQNVYDTATGKLLMIPQGTQLVGTYDSKVSFGQDRVLVVWNRLIMPDASAVELGNMPGSDMAGYAGLADEVDHHYFRIFGSALLMSVVSAGFAIATDDDDRDDNEQSAQSEVARTMAQTTDRILQRNLNLQPTITIRPGLKFNVFVNKDIRFLEPYAG